MKQDLKNVLRVLVAIVLGMVVCWLLGGCKTRYKATEVVRHDTLTIRDTAYIERVVQTIAQRQDSTEHHRWATEMVRVTVYDTIGRVVQTTDIAKQSGSTAKQGSKAVAQASEAKTQSMSHTEVAGHSEQGKVKEKVEPPVPWWCWAALVACACLIIFDMWLAVKAWGGGADAHADAH